MEAQLIPEELDRAIKEIQVAIAVIADKLQDPLMLSEGRVEEYSSAIVHLLSALNIASIIKSRSL